MSDLDVLAIVGSLRKESLTLKVAEAVAALGPEGMTIEITRSDLPLYDGDRDGDESPADVVGLRERVAGADGLLVLTPEYNYGVPGPLKNTLDWLSRPAYRSVLRDKPATTVGVSPGPSGATRAVSQVNDTLVAVAASVLPWPALTIPHVASDLDDGRLDDKVADRAGRQLAAFADWIDAMEVYRSARSR